jgi:hypothetical protein
VTVARDKPDAGSIAARDHPIAVVFNFMQPFRPFGRARRGRWLARFDEAGP